MNSRFDYPAEIGLNGRGRRCLCDDLENVCALLFVTNSTVISFIDGMEGVNNGRKI